MDFDKTIAPRREHADDNFNDVTVPGKRDRKNDGRFAVGDLIMNRYKILAELGQGGMGVVYKCFDETAGIEIALKALPPELSHNTLEMEDIKENFQLVSKLVHQNIAISKNLERDSSSGNYYLIMECCDGDDLRRWIRRKRQEGSLTLDDVLPIIRQTASALDYAHEMRVMHRDIKPGNIMIDQYGRIKVLDFGLAAQIHTSMTRVSMAYHGTSGTGPYMAPEQWRGRVQGAPADQYALAVMTYEMLAGHLPFESSDPAVLKQAVLDETPEEISDIPPSVQNALKRAMSKNPEERFESCSDFAAALGGKKIKAANGKGGNFPVLAVVITSVVMLLAAAGIYYMHDQNRKELACLAEKHRQITPETPSAVEDPPAPAEEKPVVSFQAPTEKETVSVPPVPPVEKPVISPPAHSEKETASAKLDTSLLEMENADLAIGLKTRQKFIDAHRYDRGQTFGRHLDDMQNKYISARDAEARKDHISANKLYREADRAAKWIITNAPLRIQAQILQKQVIEQKNDTDRYSDVKASVAYQLAAEQYKAANIQYDMGDFTQAAVNYRTALDNYSKACVESQKLTVKKLIQSAESSIREKNWTALDQILEQLRPLDSAGTAALSQRAGILRQQEKLETVLAAARSAAKENDWNKVRHHASLALQYDKNNIEALKLCEEASEKRPMTLEISAMIDGKEVPATVKFGSHTFDTIDTKFTGFVKNTAYSAELSYILNKEIYTAKLSFNTDWHGDLKRQVKLERNKPQQFMLPGGIPLDMIKISRGSFIMGSPDDEEGRDNDEVLHKVTLSRDYWLGKYEITQKQYRAVMKENPSYFPAPEHPVEKVSWIKAKAFCSKINELLADKLPRGYKFDLPTEAQWEYACRAGTTTSLSNGRNMRIKTPYNTPDLDGTGWYGGNCGQNFHYATGYNISGWSGMQYPDLRGGSHPVGTLAPNAWGLYDMHGNVAEWCNDWDGPYTGDAVDPQGPASGKFRSIRGGSWQSYNRFCRSASRYGRTPEGFSFDEGFRVALVADENHIDSSSDSLYESIRAIPSEHSTRKLSGAELYKLALEHKINNRMEQAKIFFLRAFRAGYYDKNCKLGKMYESDGDWQNAVRYYQSAADTHNDSDAMLAAALVCLQNANKHAMGKEYLEKSAKLGNAKAMFNLGCCYAKLRGADFPSFEYSREQAIHWLKKAGGAGITQAEQILKFLEKTKH